MMETQTNDLFDTKHGRASSYFNASHYSTFAVYEGDEIGVNTEMSCCQKGLTGSTERLFGVNFIYEAFDLTHL